MVVGEKELESGTYFGSSRGTKVVDVEIFSSQIVERDHVAEVKRGRSSRHLAQVARDALAEVFVHAGSGLVADGRRAGASCVTSRARLLRERVGQPVPMR